MVIIVEIFLVAILVIILKPLVSSTIPETIGEIKLKSSPINLNIGYRQFDKTSNNPGTI